MTQENKQLLLKDLCGRFPYGVMMKVTPEGGGPGGVESYDMKLNIELLDVFPDFADAFKPYLRPMSSMTEEEKLKLDDMEFEIAHLKFTTYAHECMILDYLYSRHLDVRGLIPMGLALEATEDMYKQ